MTTHAVFSHDGCEHKHTNSNDCALIAVQAVALPFKTRQTTVKSRCRFPHEREQTAARMLPHGRVHIARGRRQAEVHTRTGPALHMHACAATAALTIGACASTNRSTAVHTAGPTPIAIVLDNKHPSAMPNSRGCYSACAVVRSGGIAVATPAAHVHVRACACRSCRWCAH